MTGRWLWSLAGIVLLVSAASASGASPDAGARQTIRQSLRDTWPGLAIDAIDPSPVDGVYAVTIGATVVYVTGDGKHMMQGELIDLQSQRSLTEDRRRALRLQRINAIGEDRMLIFEPEGETRYEVTVFTDIDCPYCRRLHEHIDEYNARGIRIRYLFMPRAGLDSVSYDKAVWTWCAEHPREALTRAKRGEPIAHRDCPNPVKAHYELSRELGVRGTPAIVTERGTLIPGYQSPADLERLLNREHVAGQAALAD